MARAMVDDAANHGIETLDPRAERPHVTLTPLTTRLDALDHATVYFINARNHHFDPLFERIIETLNDQYTGVTVEIINKPGGYWEDVPEFWDEVEASADAFVFAGAHSSSTTHYTVSWSALLEERGVPGVSIVYTPLEPVAKRTTDKRGTPVRVTAVDFPLKDLFDSEIDAAVEGILSALTASLSTKEQERGTVAPDPPGTVAFEGSYNAAQAYYHEQGWTDGQAIVPPTEGAVADMLTGTSHNPEELVAEEWGPEGWDVTVESVAINAVMAGADPAYMPVLLATVEAANDIETRGISFGDWVRSTNSFAFMQVVNGPIAEEIGMNAGTYATAPGNHANAVIGRALQLFIRNLGGGEEGVNMQATIGNNTNYGGFAFPENEADSPWEPYHVTQGFQKDDSVLTLKTLWNTHVGNYSGLGLDPLSELARNMGHLEYPNGMVALISPGQATHLAEDEEMDKDDVTEFLFEHSTRQLGQLRERTGFWNKVEQQHEGYNDRANDAIVEVYPRENIRPVVVGGHTNPMLQGWNALAEEQVVIDEWR